MSARAVKDLAGRRLLKTNTESLARNVTEQGTEETTNEQGERDGQRQQKAMVNR